MSTKDPIESLETYYTGKPPVLDNDSLLPAIFAANNKKRHRLLGAACGFTVGTAAAILLLTWAARPAEDNRNATASAIARYQMINSGLVEAPASKGSRIR